MGFLVSSTQSEFLGMSLGLSVFIFGVLQTVEGIYLAIKWWNDSNDILRIGSRTIVIINIADGITGISASLSASVILALTAAVGYAIDGLAHITSFILRWVAFIEDVEASKDHALDVTWYLGTIFEGLFTIAVIVLTCFMVRTTLTFYQVLLVGGTGWEKMSPGELLDKEFGLLEMDDYRRGMTMMEEVAMLEASNETKRREERVFI